MPALKISLHCFIYILCVHCFWLLCSVPCIHPAHSAYPFPQEKAPWLSITCVFHSQCYHEDLYTCCLMDLLCIKMCMYRGTWQHWLDGHEFEQSPGADKRWGSLVCCSPWGRKESDMTERPNWTCVCVCVCVCVCTSLMAQQVKNLPPRQETWVWSLDGTDPLEKENSYLWMCAYLCICVFIHPKWASWVLLLTLVITEFHHSQLGP